MTADVAHRTMEELQAGLGRILESPKKEGVLRLIVRRPEIGAREVLDEAELDVREGLVGDNWSTRGSSRTEDGAAHPDMQINLMNSRVIELIAGHPDRWRLAGDQLLVDLDLSAANLPPGTRLALGSAVLEVTAQPHTGCAKFVERFGRDAMKFVNSPVGRELHLRGINARVLKSGRVRAGDAVRKLPAPGAGFEPVRLETGRPMLLGGLRRHHDFATAGHGLRDQWREFLAGPALPDRVGLNAYGVMCGHDATGFEYMCAVEVESLTALRDGTGRMRVAERLYAVFAHDAASPLRATWERIFDWLSRGEYESAHAPDFEVYGPGADPVAGTDPIEVWVGVVPRTGPTA